MSRILILHALLGTGHLHAANALAAAFALHPDVETEVIDVLELASPVLRTAMTEYYKQTSERTPLIYRALFQQSDSAHVDDAVAGNLRLARLERPFLRDLERHIAASDLDAVVCVHPIAAWLMQLLRHDGALPQPFFVVVTDFLAHGTWLVEGAARYFLPSELTRFDLIGRGVAEDLLEVTGIPIRLEIAHPKTAADARQRLGLPFDLPVTTLFGGGIEPQRVRGMVSRLLESPIPGILIVVAGRSDQLEAALADLSDGPRMALRTLGMVDYVDDLIVASDLIVTKAGGLIVSEVVARGTPLVIVDPLPGQEDWNADFVAASGVGIQLRAVEMLPPTVIHLLLHPERRAWMREQALFVGRPRAAHDIAERVLAVLNAAPAPVPATDDIAVG